MFKAGTYKFGSKDLVVTVMGDPKNPAVTTLTVGDDSVSFNQSGQVVSLAPATKPKRAATLTKIPDPPHRESGSEFD